MLLLDLRLSFAELLLEFCDLVAQKFVFEEGLLIRLGARSFSIFFNAEEKSSIICSYGLM